MSLRDTLRERLLNPQKEYRTVKDSAGNEWTIRAMTVGEKDRHNLSMVNQKTGKPDFSKLTESKCRLVATLLVDPETKEPLLSGDEWRQLEQVPGSTIDDVYNAAVSLSPDEEPMVQELVGNFG